jgi:hypothetical protein
MTRRFRPLQTRRDRGLLSEAEQVFAPKKPKDMKSKDTASKKPAAVKPSPKKEAVSKKAA